MGLSDIIRDKDPDHVTDIWLETIGDEVESMEKEIEYLRTNIDILTKALIKLTKKKEEVEKLEHEIEILKNCWNCKHYKKSINTCNECSRQTFNQGQYDYWEILKVI